MKKWGLIACLSGLLLLSERVVAQDVIDRAESPVAVPLETVSAEAVSEGKSALVAFPKDKLETPVLLSSRLLDSNRSKGKVFAPGQRNPSPLLREFVRTEEGVEMRPLCYRSPEGYRPQMPKIPCPPVTFPIVRESVDSLWLDVSVYFSTYPEAVSVVPRQFLKERADSAAFLGIRTRERYIQVVNRYIYPSGMMLKTACSFIFLQAEAMPIRQVDKTKVGYNAVEFRDSTGKRVEGIRKWNFAEGRPLVFYVDSACPASWFPYIKEGMEDWNKAFAKLGLASRIEVRPEPRRSETTQWRAGPSRADASQGRARPSQADASQGRTGPSEVLRRDPLVNWVRLLDVDEPNAKGDVLFDPRSGEILQADILIWKSLPRLLCDWRYVQTGAADPAARAEEYPIEMLGPMLRYSICHEMGHILGLSHNMGASYAYPASALHKPDFTREYGTAASVMDYARFNHLATAADVKRGVSLLPPRLGPYDYYAIAWGYGPDTAAAVQHSAAASTSAIAVSPATSAPVSAFYTAYAGPDARFAYEPTPGPYCYFAPFQSGPISPDPSALPEALGDDLLASSRASLRNCRALLALDGLNEHRLTVLKHQYYRSIYLTLSNIGGVIAGKPVRESIQSRTLDFIFRGLATVPSDLRDPRLQQQILDELDGNFLPRRICENGGAPALQRYRRHLDRLRTRWNSQLNLAN